MTDTAITPPPGNALAPLEKDILTISPAMKPDDVATILDRVQFFKRILKELEEKAEASIVEWIKANGELNLGNGVRYYLGSQKVTKCINIPATVEALLSATGGDFNKFCEVLAANAIKHGAAKKTLSPEDFARLFNVEYRETLEEGKPVKTLQKADERFIR